MDHPVIGITVGTQPRPGRYGVTMAYALAVERAGGIPFFLPYRTGHDLIPPMLDRLDGVVLSGGDDPDPARWGEARHPQAVPLNPHREAFELALLEEIDRRRMPVLGICLGVQMMNIHRGGTLHQFLPDRCGHGLIEHRQVNGKFGAHPIELCGECVYSNALGKATVAANTSHKQAINRLGRGLRIIATAPDGVIEGIVDESRPLFLGVQWHPELLVDDPDHLKLFELLVKAAQNGSEVRVQGSAEEPDNFSPALNPEP